MGQQQYSFEALAVYCAIGRMITAADAGDYDSAYRWAYWLSYNADYGQSLPAIDPVDLGARARVLMAAYNSAVAA